MGHIPDNWTCKLNLKLLGLVELLLCARDFQGNFELEHSASKFTIFQGTCIPIQIPQVLLQVVIASPCSNHLFPPDNYFSQYILCSTSRIMGHLLPTQLHMKRFIKVVFMNYEFVVYTSLVVSMNLIWNSSAALDMRATYNMIRQLKLSCVAATKSDMAYNCQHYLTAASLSSQRIPTLELLWIWQESMIKV